MTTSREYAQQFIQLIDRTKRMPLDGAYAKIHELGLSHSHLRAMFILEHQPGLPMKDLAEALAMTPPSVTVLTRKLEASGLLERLPDQVDSRRVLLQLSADGSRMLAEMHNAHLDRFTQLLSGLSPSDQAQFLALMNRAVEALERMYREESEP